jgi:hypothetical protein
VEQVLAAEQAQLGREVRARNIFNLNRSPIRSPPPARSSSVLPHVEMTGAAREANSHIIVSYLLFDLLSSRHNNRHDGAGCRD